MRDKFAKLYANYIRLTGGTERKTDGIHTVQQLKCCSEPIKYIQRAAFSCNLCENLCIYKYVCTI